MLCARNAALLTLVAALAACSDMAMAPQQPTVAAPSNLTGPANGRGSTQDLTPGDTLHFTITIDPNRSGSYDLGNGHSVYFPAGAVCDPAKSTYGPTEWDQKCFKLNYNLTLQVTAWIDANGHPFEDFSPSVRFAPATKPSDYVILSLTDREASVDPSMNILYCAAPGQPCTNEALSDPTLVTNHDPVTGKVWRRIKHFSGYNVAAGDDSIDPSSMSANALGRGISHGLPMTVASRGRDVAPDAVTIVRPKRVRLPANWSARARESGYILASG
jgi:hypothetical protein